MRSLTPPSTPVSLGNYRADWMRVQVKDSGGTWRDLTSYPGFNAVHSATWKEDVDSPHATADVTLFRELEGLSLAPLMAASPVNNAFAYPLSYSPLLALNRELKIECALMPMDMQPATGDWQAFFHGRIDNVDPGAGDKVKLTCRDLGGVLADTFIEVERVYGLCAVSGVPVGARVWEPEAPFVAGEYVIPTLGPTNLHFFKCTTGGTSGATEPAWDTVGASTTADNLDNVGVPGSGTLVWTESGATGVDDGYAAELLLQGILDDNLGAGVVTLAYDASSWIVTPYKQERVSVLDALRTFAQQIGWDVRYRWASTSFELTFFEPERSKTTPDTGFGTADYKEISKLAIDKSRIRNTIKVLYTDSGSLFPDGKTPRRKQVTAHDATSETLYGRLYAEITEAKTSQIDSAVEAQRMADAALADLKDPEVEQQLQLLFGFPWAELGDLYEFQGNNRHYSGDQTLAVFSASHTAAAGKIRTTISTRGKPTLGYDRWHKIFTRVQPRQPQTLFGSGAAPVVTATPVVGGVRITIDTSTLNRGSPVLEFEHHISKTPSFIPGPDTLVTVSKSITTEIANLVPGVTYHTRSVPRGGTSPMNATPSSPTPEQSFVAGRAYAGHLDQVASGQLPPNFAFEHAFADLSLYPPDHWTPDTGIAWGSSGDVYYGTDADYGRTLILRDTVSKGTMFSALFPIARQEIFSIETVFKPTRASGSTAFNIVVEFYKDTALTPASTASVTFALGTGGGASFQAQNRRAQTSPSDANFARIRLEKASADANLKLEIGDVRYYRYLTPAANSTGGGDKGAVNPTFLNDFVDKDSGLAIYWLDPSGATVISGRINPGASSSLGSGSTARMFQLPSGLRPGDYDRIFLVYLRNATGSVDGSAFVRVGTDGYVYAMTGDLDPASWWDLSPVRFYR